jgi:DNA mismatch repair protein MutL
MQQQIKVLPSYLVNRIAAGEVVERPASVLKELVENSIDAGASLIEIEIQDGGKSIVVHDNGRGMSPADVEICVLNHATSKITCAEDLERILTMGFRGEALASISAISRFECRSRRIEEADGTQLKIEGGEHRSLTPIGCTVGTTMQVEDLFFNTPARLKFLKRSATELSYCDEMAKSLALAHPKVQLKLILNGKVAFHTKGTGNLLETVQSLFEFREEQVPHLLETHFEDALSGLRLDAVFASPACESLQKKSKKHWWMLLNHRPIRCAVLQRAISSAYESLVPHGTYPFCALWLTMPADAVDVNVHPTKKEVRYADSAQIYQFVHTALRRALSSHFEQVYAVSSSPSTPMMPTLPLREASALPPASSSSYTPYVPYPPLVSFEREDLPEQDSTAKFYSSSFTPPSHVSGVSSHTLSLIPRFQDEKTPELKRRNWRVIGQLYSTYILLETPKGLMVVDQHIASERWCFEALQQQHETEKVVVQSFVTPLILDVNLEEADVLQQYADALEKVGFQCRPVQADTLTKWELWSVPVLYPDRTQYVSPLQQLKHMIEQWLHQPTAHLDTEALYSTMACHMAIRAGDVLNPVQQERVVEDWLTCTLPWSCPHGRPIAHTIDAKSLNNFFDRPSLPANAGI